ncbi:hypothetical protein [Serratia liquefaciens]|uniref:Uncharacterized protein n=1 Tax=Serratia liquefaciens TaxID=614 RepID=A0A515D5J1_SERLI|nr:hypothetical protein [Serratia liquefaciens]QDL35672.1 hypothetical protein EGO53_28125 [Serratia liquefaciens]
MTLSLTSSNAELDSELKKITSDNSVGIAEFQSLRDSADVKLESITDPVLVDSLKNFQNAADQFVETLQKVALAARKNKISTAERESLKFAVEAQVAYAVIGYKSSLERI